MQQESLCWYCGGNASEPNHKSHCDGRQGKVEARERPPEFTPPRYDAFTHARPTDPDTSHEAAWLVNATEVQRRVYAIFKRHMPRGLTDEELVEEYARLYPPGTSLESRASPRKRRSDLTNAGILVDSGQRRRLKSGRLGVVWILKVD